MKKYCLLTLCVLAFTAAAQAAKYGDLNISPKTFLPPGASYYHGYCEITFQITNNSRQNAHVVKVTFPGIDSEIVATRTVRVDPGATVNSVIYLPKSSYYSTNGIIEIDGRRQVDLLPVAAPTGGSSGYYYGGSSDRPRYILRSRNVPASLGEAFETKSSGSSDEIHVARSESDVQSWSDNYLAYTPCDAVIIDAKDWAAMKPAIKEAIKQYVSSGGLLAIGGMDEVPAELQMGLAVKENSAVSAPLGFGKCFVFATNDDFAKNNEFNRYLGQQRELQYSESVESITSRFQIVDMNRLPVKGMLIVLVIFSILIGPVLMFVLSKYRRRIWMFWLVPLISLVACLGLFIFSVISEGFTPTLRTSTLTLLDENTNQATTIGLYGIYAPLTPGDGLAFPASVEVSDLVNTDSNRKKFINWSSEQQLESGWVAARVPTYFNIRQCTVRRERVNVKYKGDTPVSIVNGLGADIETFKLCDSAGDVYMAQDVPAGQEAKLVKSGATSKKIRRSLTDELRDSYSTSMWKIAPTACESLLPGTYRAQLKSDPFTPTGVSSPILKQNCIVIGICRRTGNAD